MVKKLKVSVDKGLFSTERTVTFEASGRRHVMVVDEKAVSDDNMMAVHVVGEERGQAVVRLPAETFAGTSRVAVPKDSLE